MADDSGSSSILGTIMSDAVAFATPFAKQVLASQSTPQQIQRQTLNDAALNGSGPNDPTLAKQSPLGLWDFITGGKVTGGTQAAPGGGGLMSGGSNVTLIAIVAIIVVAVFVILKK